MPAITTYHFNVAEFEKLHGAGILGEDDRVELLNGELLVMAPIGSDHRNLVDLLTEVLVDQRQGRYRVAVQNPIRLGDYSEPLPDLVLYRIDRQGPHPTPADIFLLIEVAESSIEYDSGTKLSAYARSGIGEVWIIDLAARKTYIHRSPDPTSGAYAESHVAPWAALLSPATFPDIQIGLSRLMS
jgi:MEMO1 family protein